MSGPEVDAYLRSVLAAHAVPAGLLSPVGHVMVALEPVIRRWGNQFIVSINPSGSFSKGTAVHGGTDVDIFVSLTSTLTTPLKDIYDTLFNALSGAGYVPRRQNVSIGITVGNYKVDVTPARRHDQTGNYHSLYSNKTGSWLQTNVSEHIRIISQSGRLEEIRLLKVWRNRLGFDFPSFYLELFTLDALSGRRVGNLSPNIVTVLEAIRDNVASRTLIDPANTNNIVSNTLNATEKAMLAQAARNALASNWNQVFV
ncbi:TPA: hypothetical protein ACWMDK_000564 [Pseudomonas aeruginosa]|nr:hypothetical protein [Pseudomonas aeruginosa]